MKHPLKTIPFALMICLTGAFVSCTEKKTEDPIEAYKYWAGELPAGNIKVARGKYWQSAHWSREYILYLELTAPPEWRTRFITQNKLAETKQEYALPSDAPDWFKPGKGFRTLAPAAPDQGSVYYEDSVTGEMFIYEIQL
ncbi:MAG TPA: hypothetical protein VG052_12410 [Puia sp.]|nr:hypothetical protein [Puia sp.]